VWSVIILLWCTRLALRVNQHLRSNIYSTTKSSYTAKANILCFFRHIVHWPPRHQLRRHLRTYVRTAEPRWVAIRMKQGIYRIICGYDLGYQLHMEEHHQSKFLQSGNCNRLVAPLPLYFIIHVGWTVPRTDTPVSCHYYLPRCRIHYKPVVSNSTRKLLFDTKYPTLFFETVAICPFFFLFVTRPIWHRNH
jgi:hypothetical protein